MLDADIERRIPPAILDEVRAMDVTDDQITSAVKKLKKLPHWSSIQYSWELYVLCCPLEKFKDSSDPNLLKEANWGSTLVHYAALSGKPEVLAWVTEKYPAIRNNQDTGGSSIAHYASLSGNPEMLDWLRDNQVKLELWKFNPVPYFDQSRSGYHNEYGQPVHWAAMSGNPAMLAWFRENSRKHNQPMADFYLPEVANKEYENVGVYAAKYGTPEMLDWIRGNYPQFDFTSRGASYFHSERNLNMTAAIAAASTRNIDNLRWIKKNHPHLINIHVLYVAMKHEKNPQFLWDCVELLGRYSSFYVCI